MHNCVCMVVETIARACVCARACILCTDPYCLFSSKHIFVVPLFLICGRFVDCVVSSLRFFYFSKHTPEILNTFSLMALMILKYFAFCHLNCYYVLEDEK